MVVVTWNVQPTSREPWPSPDLPWYAFIRYFFSAPDAGGLGADVVCLQQAGAPPGPLPGEAAAEPPRWIGAPTWQGAPPAAGLAGRYFCWKTPTAWIYILWLNTDRGGGDMTLAVCSLTPPAALRYVSAQSEAQPAIGVTINEGPNAFHIFSLMSAEPDGNASALLRAIDVSLPGAAWIAAGDFGQPPESVDVPEACVVCGPPPGRPTDVNGDRNDFLVKAFGRQVTGTVFGHQQRGLSAHFPVAFVL